ncbi:conjugative transposon protein TraM [Fibrella aquatica]|uniref:conjugative transposon protein TraM n=1 Tax=Fibrella aquatica TaxID=3242487 RepID=UPI0035225549
MNLTDPTQPENYIDNPSPADIPDPAVAPTARKSFQDVLKDKRFWMTAPVLLLALGSTGYFLIAGTESKQMPLINNVNATIPNAQTDSVPKSKLELQAAEQRQGLNSQSTVNGMQTGVVPALPASAPSTGLPATLDPYVYKQKRMPEAIDPEFAAMDSLYNPSPPPRQNRVGGRPRPTNRIRAVSTGYAQTALPDEFDEEALPRRDVQKQVEDRQRLLALLTEYKRDKEAKAAIAREGERPRKAESGAVVSTLGETTNRRLNGFYGLYTQDQKGGQESALTEDLGTIRAVIHQDQQITDGGRVQLRLLEPVTVRGVLIPANTLVFGTGSFGTERVGITLSNLQYEGHIFPIKLTVHDMDGMPGVFVPNVLAAQEGKQLLGQTISGANYNLNGTSANSAKAAATMAGISAAQSGLSGARSILQRKIVQQKATLKGNYYVLLK